MGRSPESPLSLCPSNPIEPANEALEEDRAVPIPAAATRRKSSTWKTFNLKRQLSKVDQKIKNTGNRFREKRNSIFYGDISPNQDIADNLEEEENTSPESEENTVIDNLKVLSTSPITPLTPMEVEGKEEFLADIKVLNIGQPDSLDKIPIRPDNLDLIDEENYPVRPPRQNKKKEKRGLSVPNVKLQISELLTVQDLRDKEDALPPNQPSFATNLIRRFSKFLYVVQPENRFSTTNILD